MRKRFLAAAAILLLLSSVNAQSIRLQAGVNLSNFKYPDNYNLGAERWETRKITGLNFGAVCDFRLGEGKFHLQPGLLFSSKGMEIESENMSVGTWANTVTRPYYLELPLNLVFKTDPDGDRYFFFGGGPYIAMGITGKLKSHGIYQGAVSHDTNENIEYTSNERRMVYYPMGLGLPFMKRFDYGINGTTGYSRGKFTAALNYGHGLAQVNSGIDYSFSEGFKNRVWTFTMGFRIR